MKNIIKASIASLILATSVFALPTEGPCNSGDLQYVTNANNNNGSCYTTPISYEVKLFKVLLCANPPEIINKNIGNTIVDNSIMDLSMCDGVLFSSDNGVDFNLQQGSSANFDNAKFPNVEDKTYRYAAIVASNHLKIKDSKKFAQAMTGATDSGLWCWTRNVSIQGKDMHGSWWNDDSHRLNWGAECGSTPNPDVMTLIANDNDNIVDGDESNDNFRAITVDNNLVVHSDSTNNTKLLLAFPLDETLNLKNLTSLDLRVRITNSSEVNMHDRNGHYSTEIFMPAPFYLTIQAR